ncbi:DUF2793 domain-containing protein [Ochrobactrum haematophilum]|uniref:DUF2793 domain-containing protein n=1 Tax=Brucella haematophila TaxID=419474 RepID=A0ABX1DMW0_9HYPH|nr:DUF2793 domain-containing protein [Brucella haematophila]
MDRVNGNNWVDIGDGKRGFRSQNAAAGIAGTEVTDKILNDMQEEICAVIENSGFELNSENQQQLWEALQTIAAPGFSNRLPFLPILSSTMANPPNDATVGDAYIVPAGATGAWDGMSQKLAEWTGSFWRLVSTKDGHGVGLPDGRSLMRVGGVYVEKTALDVQSGTWLYGVASGSANALTAVLNPAPPALVAGMSVRLLVATTNTAAGVTLNLNGLGAKSIFRKNANSLIAGDIKPGLIELIYDGAYWRLMSLPISAVNLGSNGAMDLQGGVTMQWGIGQFVAGDGGKRS